MYADRRLLTEEAGALTGDAGGTFGADDGARTSVARGRVGADTDVKDGFVGDAGAACTGADAS